MTMQYRLICYNRSTDEAGGLFPIPGRYLARVLKIAGIKNAKELGEYPLNDEQIRDIAALIGLKPDLSRFAYHLEPFGSTQDRLRA
jgi:hypothetical protein